METASENSDILTLDRALRAVSSQRAQLAHTLCHQLLTFDDLRGPAHLGFASLREYGEHALGLTAREVRECLRVGRRLRALPRLDAALEAGALSWSAARALTRVVVPETEADWLEEAKSHSMRELEAALSVSSAGDLPPDPGSRPVAPAVTRFVFEVDSTDAQFVADALALRRSELGGDLDVADVFVDLCRTALAAAEAPAALASAAPTPISPERFQIVLQKCPTCEAVVHVGRGPVAHAVSPAVAAQAECDAVIIHTTRAAHATASTRATRTVPPATRRRVTHRDGHRCVVPGCDARLWLDVHHLVPRAEGGTHADSNLAILCSRHHRRVHEGTLHLGRTPDGAVVVHRGAAPKDTWARTTHTTHTTQATDVDQPRATPVISAPITAAVEGCAAEFGWVVPAFVAQRLAVP
jgi:5-methylcytosine-specific restriction endonuclease McrA